ncbi:MAG TPA: hypothetical protein VN372_04780 [Methanospirillum sp.]|nr:hypothetical protein [Methanospirillum sp.]
MMRPNPARCDHMGCPYFVWKRCPTKNSRIERRRAFCSLCGKQQTYLDVCPLSDSPYIGR